MRLRSMPDDEGVSDAGQSLKRRKLADAPTGPGRKLLVGERVEVLLLEEGLKGSWNAGVVVGCAAGSRCVKYDEICENGGSARLTETFRVSDTIEGLTKKQNRNFRGNIRPPPPHISFDVMQLRYSMCVDALVGGTWWEGVIFDHKDGSMERLVFFPDQGDRQAVDIGQMRQTFDWDEVSGDWKARDCWVLLKLLEQLEQKEVFPISIREIWYDVSCSILYRQKIEHWFSGSLSMWNKLVINAIKEAAAVAEGQTLDVVSSGQSADKSLDSSNNVIQIEGVPCMENSLSHADDFQMPIPSPDEADDPSALSNLSLLQDGEYLPSEKNANEKHISTEEGQWLETPYIGEKDIPRSPGNMSNKTESLPPSKFAKSDLLDAGWKLKVGRGYKIYISPSGKRYRSLREAWKIYTAGPILDDVTTPCVHQKSACGEKNVKVDNRTVDMYSDVPNEHVRSYIWKLEDVEAEYCPDAISYYASSAKQRKANIEDVKETDLNYVSARIMARKHLAAMGWKLYCKIEGTKQRFRYCSPDGKNFYSLNEICKKMTNKSNGKMKNPRTDNFSGCVNMLSEFQSEGKLVSDSSGKKLSMIDVTNAVRDNIVSDAFPKEVSTIDANGAGLGNMISEHIGEQFSLSDASAKEVSTSQGGMEGNGFRGILDYVRYMENKMMNQVSHASEETFTDAKLKAKENLKCLGWRFCCRNTRGRCDMYYVSPKKRSFYSLLRACRACLKEQTEETAKVSTQKSMKENFHQLAIDCVGASEMKLFNCSAVTSDMFQETDNLLNCKNNNISASGSDLLQFVGVGFHNLHKKLSRRCSRRVKNLVLPSSVDLQHKEQKIYPELGSGCQKFRKGAWPLTKHFNESGNSVSRSTPRVTKQVRDSVSSPADNIPRTVLSLLINNNVVSLRQKVRYVNKNNGEVTKEGFINRDGIKCKCCNQVFSLSTFEVHAGSTGLQPAANIYLKDGRSLLECQEHMLKIKEKHFIHRRAKGDFTTYPSDAICSMCQDGGTLVLCDLCPSSYHLECVGLEDVPEGKWYCPSCICNICGLNDFNNDIKKFTDDTKLYCDQCERECHVGCLKKTGMVELTACPRGYWFCSETCSKMFHRFRELVGRSNPTAVDGLTWTLLRSNQENHMNLDGSNTLTRIEHHCKLQVAVDILHECFTAMVEPRTERDIVEDLVFNEESELRRLNFWGFYTMILEKGDELISVATFRVYGDKAAEMPLVGTNIRYRRQGMCRLLIDELEKLLVSLGIEKLLLPAVPQLVETWTNSFGFVEMSNSNRLLLSEHVFLNFQGSTMLEKHLGLFSSSLVPSDESRENACHGNSHCEPCSLDSEVNTMGQSVDDRLSFENVALAGTSTGKDNIPSEVSETIHLHLENISTFSDEPKSPADMPSPVRETLHLPAEDVALGVEKVNIPSLPETIYLPSEYGEIFLAASTDMTHLPNEDVAFAETSVGGEKLSTVSTDAPSLRALDGENAQSDVTEGFPLSAPDGHQISDKPSAVTDAFLLSEDVALDVIGSRRKDARSSPIACHFDIAGAMPHDKEPFRACAANEVSVNVVRNKGESSCLLVDTMSPVVMVKSAVDLHSNKTMELVEPSDKACARKFMPRGSVGSTNGSFKYMYKRRISSVTS